MIKKIPPIFTLGVIMLAFLCVSISAEAADNGNGSIRVSANKRYLEYVNGKPFYYQGDTIWALFYELSRSEITTLLDQRKARGFNVIQIFGILDWSNMYIDTVIANQNGDQPFIDKNPEKLNADFWNNTKWILNEIRERDMYAAISVGLPLRSDKRYFIPYTNNAKAYRSGYQLGKTLKAYNNAIIWVGGNDMNLAGVDKAAITNINAQMEGIADAVNGVSQNYNKSANYSTTLMTYHPNGLHSSADYFHTKNWLDFNWIQTYGNLDKAVTMLKKDYNRSLVKPVLLAEGTYEDTRPNRYVYTKKRYKHYVPSAGTSKYYADQYDAIQPWHIRYQAYQTVFAGAAGIGYGHRGLIQTVTSSWSRDYAKNAKGAWGLKYLKNLMNTSDIRKLVPDNSLIVSTEGTFKDVETHMVVGIRSSDKKRAYIYTTRGRAFTVKLSSLAGDSIFAQWYNPRTGAYDKIGKKNKVNTYFNPEGSIANNNDWVLVLEAQYDDTTDPDPTIPNCSEGAVSSQCVCGSTTVSSGYCCSGSPQSSSCSSDTPDEPSSSSENCGTVSGVTHDLKTVNFNQSFNSSPIMVAAMQTRNGSDPSGLRMKNVTKSSFTVKVEEENSVNSEMEHGEEVVGYFTFNEGTIKNSAGSIIGESGDITKDQPNGTTWYTVTLKNSYSNPVVLMNMNTYNGSNPSHIRIKNVNSNSFQFQIEEWDYLDGVHSKAETMGYVVIKAGKHLLSNGKKLEAGKITTNAANKSSYATVGLSQSFDKTPVVISQVQTYNGSSAVVIRQKEISKTSFKLQMQEEEENKDSTHSSETVGFIAINP